MTRQTYLIFYSQKPNYKVPRYNRLQHQLLQGIILLHEEIHFSHKDNFLG